MECICQHIQEILNTSNKLIVMAIEKKYQTLHVIFENVDQSNAIALIKMFKYMEQMGKFGSSRWCSFFADGDGSFRPNISFEYPESLPDVPKIDGIVKYTNGNFEGVPRHSEGDFAVDSDQIAWEIYYD